MAKEIKFNIEARDLMKKGECSHRKEIRSSPYHQRRCQRS